MYGTIPKIAIVVRRITIVVAMPFIFDSCYAEFFLRNFYISGPAKSSHVLGALMNAFVEVLQHVITSTHGKGDDRHGRGFVCDRRKNARVTDVEVCYIVCLCPFVCD